MTQFRIKQSQGFSLVEVLVAIIILAVGLLGLAKIQGISLLNSAESRMQTHALNFAQDKIEELRTYANTTTYSAYATNAVGTDLVGENSTFTRTWTVSACPNTVDCKNISVTVTWTGIDGSTYTINLSSQIAEIEPARSGLVVASVAMVGDTAAESAAKAAAHAAAAATYEAQVAASSDATDQQKADAAAAKARAEQAASDAQDAANTGDASEAAAQAQIAAAAAQEILDILQTLPGISYSFTGTVPASTTGMTVEDGFCNYDSGTYTCMISTHESEVTVTATDGSISASCVVDLTASPLTGCTIDFTLDCTMTWSDAPSESVGDTEGVTANQYATYNAASGACPSEQRVCSAGTLSGSYEFKYCDLVCTVPTSYINVKKKDLPATWNSTGPGTISIPSGIADNDKVKTQSPSVGTEVDCSTPIVVTF